MAKKSALSEILSTGVPETLYHYTNSTGLMGIIRSKQIWTTKITYLNDRAELQLAVDYIRDELDRQRKSIGRNKQAIAELDSKEYVLDGIDEVNVSVASFTEEGDQLSQWRGYCDIGQGYSLGFNGQSLLDQANAEGFHLVPCVYEEEEHKLIVREIVESTNEINISENPNYDEPPFYKMSFSEAVVFYAPIIKAEGFREEKEWRLISLPLSFIKADYRQGTHSLIPYWKFNIDLPTTLTSIIIGPTAESNLSLLALHGFLMKESQPPDAKAIQGHNIDLINSKIPFRVI